MGREGLFQVHLLLLFFRMRRGTDESAIESMAEAAIPLVHSKKAKQAAFLQHQEPQHNL
jgi:hypothetical protein